MLAASFDVGGNVLAIAILLIQAVNVWLTQRTKSVATSTNKTVVTELASNDGTTLRDATDRIESTLGTTPPLPIDKQHYTATEEPNDH